MAAATRLDLKTANALILGALRLALDKSSKTR